MRGVLPTVAAQNAVQKSQVSQADLIDTRGVKATELMSGISGMIRTLSKSQVVVGFSGTGAFCSPKHKYVNIPALPKGAIVPQRIADELYGFAIHEDGHLEWTDEHELETMRTEEEKQNSLFHEVWNAIEDYMIERNAILTYGGAAKCFSATETRCCKEYDRLYSQNPDIAKDLRIVGPVALTWLRAMYFGLTAPESAACFATLPQSLQARVKGYFDRIEDNQTTGDNIIAAREIYADIMKDPYDPMDPPADPSAGANAANGNGQPGQGGQGGHGMPGTGGGGPGSATGATKQMPPSQGPISTSASLKGAMEDIAAQNPGQTPPQWATVTVESSAQGGPAKDQLLAPEGRGQYQKAQAQLESVAATVASQLRRALISRTRERWKGGRIDGEIDHRRITSAVLGIPEVYRKKVKSESIDTAVQILVDCSGSMTHVLPICQKLAIILHEAFRGTPVTYEILGYTTADEEDMPAEAKVMADALKSYNAANPGAATFVRPVSIYEFKAFDARHHEVPETLGNMTNVGLGGTPTGDAILEGHRRLAARKERRHVMLVLTDGDPDDNTTARNAVQAVEGSGVTVVGLGIGSNAVKKCFRDWALLSDARDLPAVVLQNIADVLKRDRRVRGSNKAAKVAA